MFIGDHISDDTKLSYERLEEFPLGGKKHREIFATVGETTERLYECHARGPRREKVNFHVGQLGSVFPAFGGDFCSFWGQRSGATRLGYGEWRTAD